MNSLIHAEGSIRDPGWRSALCLAGTYHKTKQLVKVNDSMFTIHPLHTLGNRGGRMTVGKKGRKELNKNAMTDTGWGGLSRCNIATGASRKHR